MRKWFLQPRSLRIAEKNASWKVLYHFRDMFSRWVKGYVGACGTFALSFYFCQVNVHTAWKPQASNALTHFYIIFSMWFSHLIGGRHLTFKITYTDEYEIFTTWHPDNCFIVFSSGCWFPVSCTWAKGLHATGYIKRIDYTRKGMVGSYILSPWH